MSLPKCRVLRGHDLDAGGGKLVENAAMQIGVDAGHGTRRGRVAVYFVRYVVIVQRCDEDKWWRVLFDAISLQSGFHKQLVNLLPRCVVANGDRCVQDQAVVFC